MVTRNADASRQQGDSSVSSAQGHPQPHPHPHPSPVSAEQLRSHAGNTVTGLSASSTDNTTLQVFKSGPLLVSSKGIGWTSWKKRWFILTRTSLVFFRSDPSAAPQKGSEVNLTLGGIDLNNSASVVVRAEKKLITVLFPDGRDGRAFTLKAETSEDLYEWKNALEVALEQAPGATSTLAVEQSGIFQNDTADAIEVSFEQWRDKRPVKSSIIGRPVLFALEDADGSPSFLEKALQFIEQYGVKVEGILRQSADVDDVERRVQEYEQGKNEFSPDEDAHVIADCIKYVLRELPSSPVPVSCCTSLLEAFRTGRGSRVNALHDATSKTFPEPNRQLLQRVLKMMRTVVYHKSENRMSTSAVAACMAPLLLRPLLAGDCEVENDFNMGGDGSLQLLRAAAAANHAQAIIITLLEEYSNIFSDGSVSREPYSESEGSGNEYEGSTDDETPEDDSYEGAENDIDGESEDDHECSPSGSSIDNSDDDSGDLDDKEVAEDVDSQSECLKIHKDSKADEKQTNASDTPHYHQDGPSSSSSLNLSDNQSSASVIQRRESLRDASTPSRPSFESTSHSQSLCISKTRSRSKESVPEVKRRTVWGRTAAKKNLSMESIDFSSDDEKVIQSLETQKLDLQVKIATEENGNEILQASLERRKQDVYERCLALEQEVARLLDQLQRERDLRAALESGLNIPVEQLTVLPNIDDKIREESEKTALAEAEVTNLEQKIADLHVQIDQQRQQDHGPVCELHGQKLPICNQQVTWKTEKRGIRNTLAQESLPANKEALSGASHESAPIKDSLYTSDKHPTKEEPDSNNKDGEDSSATAIVLPPDVRDDISNKAGPFPQQQSPKQQNTDSVVLTTNLSSDHLSGETQASPSSSENQQLDLTLQNGPLGGASTGSSSNRESVITQDPPSLAKQQSPKMQHLNSTGLTNNSSTSHQTVKTRASPSSSEDQAPQKQQPDTTLQNINKYEGAAASSSSSYQSVKTRALLSSLEYKAPIKQQPDTSLQNGTKYEGEATSSSSNHESNISTQEPESFPKMQSPRKQHPDSIGPTTNLSTGRLSVKTRLPSSSSENQTMHKQHPDLTIQNNKFEGATTSSASKFEVVTIQDLPPSSSKLPNQKQHLNQKQQPDSPYPNRSKFGGTAPTPVTEFEKALGQNSSYLSDKQLASSQQTHSTSKNNKQLSNNQQTHSNSKNNKSKGTSAGFFGEESTKVCSSKKCSGKGEGTSGTNAMSRLTNLLNYMKERRSLDESHNQDASRNHASEGPSLGHASETTNSR